MKWVILLTTCVDIKAPHLKFYMLQRIRLYKHQLTKWLKETKFTIYVVESSLNGHVFDELKQEYSDRLFVLSFDQKKLYPYWKNSSQLEVASMNYAIDDIIKNKENFTHVFKVTGRYFLDDIQNKISSINLKPNDILTQIHFNDEIKWQNTEYFGMETNLFNCFIKSILGNINFIEHNFYNFIKSHNKQIFGPFPNNIPRWGDKQILHLL